METAVAELETMNGYVIVAEFLLHADGERVIFGVRPDTWESGFEYVTARCRPRAENPRQWYWGHYSRSFHEAIEDYQERCKP